MAERDRGDGAAVPLGVSGRGMRTFATWDAVEPAALRGHAVAVIDVLRWSTVVVAAFDAGAAWVEAYETPEAARAAAAVLRAAEGPEPAGVLLGGERGNVALPDFDLGNSPLEYTPARVRGCGVITTTTNGTRGLAAAREAALVVVAAFVNLPAVAAALRAARDAGRPLALIACGTDREEAAEDLACAGALAEAVGGDVTEVTTRRVLGLWARAGRDPVRAVGEAAHAATLRRAGFAADVHHAARSGVSACVPRLASAHRLLASSGSPPAPSST